MIGQFRKIMCFVLLVSCVFVLVVATVSRSASADALPSARANSVSTAAVADSFVASGRLYQNLDGETLWLGQDLSGGYGEERILLKFEPVVVLPQSVKSAHIVLWLGGTTPNAAGMTVSSHRLRVPWTETTVTWKDIKDNFDPASDPSVLVGTSFGSYTWDVTSIYTNWVAETPRPNELSVLLRGTNLSGQNERSFWSKDCKDLQCGDKKPVLVIDYEPTPTPTPTRTSTPTPTSAPTPTPTATPDKCWAMWKDKSTIVLPLTGYREAVFSYTLCDPDKGDALTAEIDTVSSAHIAAFDEAGKSFKKFIPLSGDGTAAIKIYPVPGVSRGKTFTLHASTVGGTLVPRDGTVLRLVYLPLFLREVSDLNATPTPSRTVSPTFTRPPTSTVTSSPTITSSPTLTDTPSPTSTATATGTSTATVTPTATTTPTATRTATNTPTNTSTPQERVQGTIAKHGQGISGVTVTVYLYEQDKNICQQALGLAVTGNDGVYEVIASHQTPYTVCIKPTNPSACTQPASQSRTFKKPGDIFTRVDFAYTCQ